MPASFDEWRYAVSAESGRHSEGLKDLGEVRLFHCPDCAWERRACPEPTVPHLSDKKIHVLMLPSVCVKIKKDDAFVL